MRCDADGAENPCHYWNACLQIKWDCYSYRWLIERYHYVLKSGCRLEQLQLEKADMIERALYTYTIVAWRLLWMTVALLVTAFLKLVNISETPETLAVTTL